jgi:hypothetical protein
MSIMYVSCNSGLGHDSLPHIFGVLQISWAELAHSSQVGTATQCVTGSGTWRVHSRCTAGPREAQDRLRRLQALAGDTRNLTARAVPVRDPDPGTASPPAPRRPAIAATANGWAVTACMAPAGAMAGQIPAAGADRRPRAGTGQPLTGGQNGGGSAGKRPHDASQASQLEETR